MGNGLLQSFIENSTLTVAHHSISYDEAVSMMIELKESFGLKVGSSSAANFKVAREIYSTLGEGSVVVTVFPSIGTDSEWEYAKAYSISNNKSLNIKHEDNYESTFDHR